MRFVKMLGLQRFVLNICVLGMISPLFGQQFLWSTELESDVPHIPLEKVTEEVLKYYDHYEFYYDGAGYSKDKFLETILNYGDKSEGWKQFTDRIQAIKKVTVFAIRDNLGRGSVILVAAISEKNVNMVVFSNYYENDPILTVPFEREKFSNWFGSLLE